MAERGPIIDSGTNWPVVAFGGMLLALAVAAIGDVFVRVIAAVAILSLTIYLSQTRSEAEVENPLLEQLREQKHGLDRRKYGRLRSFTERLLEHVRQMNRIAIEGREGKLAPRHAHAELDRIAALMRDAIDDIRKSAGVPTPTEEQAPSAQKPIQPQVVLPKASSDEEPGKPGAKGQSSSGSDDETERMLDDLVASAEGERADDPAGSRPQGESGDEAGDKRAGGPRLPQH